MTFKTMPKVQRSPPGTPNTFLDDSGQSAGFVNMKPRKKSPSTAGESEGAQLSPILAAIEGLRKDMNARFNAQQDHFDQLRTDLSQLRSDVTDVRNNFNLFRKEFDEKSKTIEFLCGAQDEQVAINADFRRKFKKLEAENTPLQTTVSELTSRIAQMEQHSRDCNIEVQCVPESRSENLLDILNQLLRTVSCKLPESSVRAVHRVAKLQSNSDRPRSIVVKMVTPQVRDAVLAAVIKFNKSKERTMDKLNAFHLGFANNKQPIYVSEHLTVANKKLHAATRITAKEKGYSYVWIRNGRIFIRKNNENPSMIVRSEDFLRTLS